MAARSNALGELTRFWLQARHGCLIDESVAVRVPYGNSDIDLVAMRPDGMPWQLPDGTPITRAIIETKDEHDFDSGGRDFAKRLRADVAALGDGSWIPKAQKAHFSMLRQEHFDKAVQIFGSDDFDRLFVVHALEQTTRSELGPLLATRRIQWLTVHELVDDLLSWYGPGKGQAALRHTLVGDLWHLLVGYCGMRRSGGAG
ncbi:hypothetical protein [Kouleothrix sp.]|uniref:hypothetical protein n=1 Tax=Kouleothrix sp. TaxID=2779161 RepID=UPI00391A7297